MSESTGDVVIKVKVDDKEAEKLVQTGKKVDTFGEKVKATGGKVKASSELFGAFANILGGSEIGAAASQVGQLTEKMGQFSAQGMAAKAGLAGIALVGGYKVGEAIGNWVFETERWNKELERSRQLYTEIGEASRTAIQGQHKDRLIDIEMANSPEAKRKLIEDDKTLLDRNIRGTTDSIKDLEKQIKEVDAAWGNSGNTKAENENRKVALEEARKNLQLYKDQRAELNGMTDIKKKQLEDFKAQQAAAKEQEKADLAVQQKSKSYLEGLKEQLALLKGTKYEQQQIAAAKNAQYSDQSEAVGLLQDIELEQKRIEKEKQLADQQKQREKEQIDNHNKIVDLYQQESTELEKQFLTLSQGQKAGEIFALMKQGLGEGAAKDIAQFNQLARQFEQSKNREATRSEYEVQVQSGRFVNAVRGDSIASIQKEQLQKTDEQNQLLQQMLEIQKRLAENPPIKIVKDGK